MNSKISNQIEILKNRLTRFNPSQVYIFGSFAYGNANDDSDLDLCVITDLKEKRKIDVIREIRREFGTLIPNALDILVYQETEFLQRASLESTLEHKILTDGLRIYGE